MYKKHEITNLEYAIATLRIKKVNDSEYGSDCLYITDSGYYVKGEDNAIWEEIKWLRERDTIAAEEDEED